jgi:hypothetical protein
MTVISNPFTIPMARRVDHGVASNTGDTYIAYARFASGADEASAPTRARSRSEDLHQDVAIPVSRPGVLHRLVAISDRKVEGRVCDCAHTRSPCVPCGQPRSYLNPVIVSV